MSRHAGPSAKHSALIPQNKRAISIGLRKRLAQLHGQHVETPLCCGVRDVRFECTGNEEGVVRSIVQPAWAFMKPLVDEPFVGTKWKVPVR